MLSIARALALDSTLFLLDEPFEGLSPAIIPQIAESIHQITKMGHSILLAESNIYHVPDFTSRLYVIERGEIIFSGRPEEVHQDKAVLRIIAEPRNRDKGWMFVAKEPLRWHKLSGGVYEGDERERVLAALKRIPDRIPWMENDIEEGLQERIMGTTDFPWRALCKTRNGWFWLPFSNGRKDNRRSGDASRRGVQGELLLSSKGDLRFCPSVDRRNGSNRRWPDLHQRASPSNESLKLFDEYLPIRIILRAMKVSKWIAQYKGLCRFARFAWGRLHAGKHGDHGVFHNAL
jgi:hypothetical protein